MLTPNQVWSKLKPIRRKSKNEMLMFDVAVDTYNYLMYNEGYLLMNTNVLIPRVKNIIHKYKIQYKEYDEAVVNEEITKIVTMLKAEYEKDHKNDY